MLEPLVGGVVGRVEDKRGVVLNDSCRQSERIIELAHPLRVPFGQIVIDRDQMSPFAFQGVQIYRQRGDEGFPFAGFHFRDTAFVEDHAADQLHVEVPHVQLAPGHFPTDGKGLGEDVIEGLSAGQPLLERLGLVGQGLIGEGSQTWFQGIDALDDRHQDLDFTVVLAAEDQIEYLCQHISLLMGFQWDLRSMLRPNLLSIPETFSESYREDTDWEGLTQAHLLQYDLSAGPARM